MLERPPPHFRLLVCIADGTLMRVSRGHDREPPASASATASSLSCGADFGNSLRNVKRLATLTPDRRPILTPREVVPVVHRRGPRRERARPKRAGERTAREVPVHPPGQPVGRAKGSGAVLERQLSLPVSTMSQWWVRRSRSA